MIKKRFNITVNWSFIGGLSSLILCLIFGFKDEFYNCYGKLPTIIFIIIIFIISVFYFIAEYNKNRKSVKMAKDLERAKQQVKKLIELNDILFKEQLISLYNDINFDNQDMRVSLYIYDYTSDKFYLLNRFSKNDVYGSIDNNKVYDNKGWLHLSFNKNIYIFSCKKNEKWIEKCCEETQKNCSYKNCKNKLSGKKCNSNIKGCIMLSNTVLKNKKMRALSVFGIPIKSAIKNTGVLLVEDTKMWNDSEVKKVKKCLFDRVHASSEIINSFYNELLELKKNKQTLEISSFEKIGDK